MKKESNHLPDYFKDLAMPTAIGREKLIALWDGLTLENQISILNLIKDDYEPPEYEALNSLYGGKPSGELPSTHSLNHKLLLKALGSKNNFVRCLAANQLYDFSLEEADTEQVKINNQIDNDKSDLVKFTKHLKAFTIPENFFELPLEARLVIFSSQRDINCSEITSVIQQANDKGLFKSKISETELNQALWELVNNSELWKEHSSEMVNTNLLIGKNELWELIPNLPLSSGSILVEKFPINSDGAIPDGLFNQLTKIQQGILFERKDFKMVDIRREFYFKDAIEKNEHYWINAANYHLNFSDEEFSEILQKPEEERASRLKWLAFARDMDLHHHLMLRFLVKYEHEEEYQREMHTELIEKNLLAYYTELKKEDNLEFVNENLYKHRLLSLAWRSAGWNKESFDTALHFFNDFFDIRVEKDIWATYLAFYKDVMFNEITYKDLPIGGFENDKDLPIELTDKETIETTLDSINKKIDKKTNELEGRFDLINKNFGWALFFIIILLIYIAK